MCELLAMSFYRRVNPQLTFKSFTGRGKRNPDGWGIGFFHDEAVQLLKEPIIEGKSALAKYMQGYKDIHTDVFLMHMRRATWASAEMRNTHPFRRELFGKDYIFAHNGTLPDIVEHPVETFHPIGETDSERAFCYLLDRIQERGIKHWEKEDYDWLVKQLDTLNTMGDLNCIFTNGRHLFAYHDKNAYMDLYYLRLKSPYETIHLEDDDFHLTLPRSTVQDQKGYIIASDILNDRNWGDIHPGELTVFQNGSIQYSSNQAL